MSRMTMISSASAGIPLRPSCALTIPSFIAPPAESVGSSQWSITGIWNVLAYSSAVRISCALDRLAVIADRYGTRAHHLAKFCQHIPLLANRDGSDRVDTRGCGPLCLTHDEANSSLIVSDGIGVRHRTNRGEASRRRGTRSRRYRLD